MTTFAVISSISWFVNSNSWRILLKENLALQARVRQKLPALGVLCPCAESRVTWICSRTMGIHLLFDQGRTRRRRVATRGGYFVSLLWLQMSGLAVAQKDDMPESAGPGAPETEMNELAQESVANAGNCSMDVEDDQELFCHCVWIKYAGWESFALQLQLGTVVVTDRGFSTSHSAGVNEKMCFMVVSSACPVWAWML